MENATKALIMAAGILLGLLIIVFMFTLFASSKEVSEKYEQTKQTDEITQFNANFIKYVGTELTIHQVVTICNFADINGVVITSGRKDKNDIKEVVENYSTKVQTYTLTINSYSSNGYVNSIGFSEVI